MAGEELGPNDVTIIIRGVAEEDRKHVRTFAGLTIDEAVKILDGNNSSMGGLRSGLITMEPYYLIRKGVRKRVGEHSKQILEPGDILNCKDP